MGFPFGFDVAQPEDGPGGRVLHFPFASEVVAHGNKDAEGTTMNWRVQQKSRPWLDQSCRRDLQHSAALDGQNAKRGLQLGDGLFQVGMPVELLPQSAEDAMGFGDVFDRVRARGLVGL